MVNGTSGGSMCDSKVNDAHITPRCVAVCSETGSEGFPLRHERHGLRQLTCRRISRKRQRIRVSIQATAISCLVLIWSVLLAEGETAHPHLVSPLLRRWRPKMCIGFATLTVESSPWNQRRRHFATGSSFGVWGTRSDLVPRGGAREDDIVPEDDQDESQATARDAASPRKNPVAAFFQSWFDLDNTTGSDAPWEQGPSSDVTEVPPLNSLPTGRGGALVSKQPPSRPHLFHWLGPLDSGRVAPSSDRLIPSDLDSSLNDEGESQRSTQSLWDTNLANDRNTPAQRSSESVVAGSKSVRRVWWADTWVEHMPDEDDEVSAYAANETDDGTNGNTSTQQLTVVDDFSISDDEGYESEDDPIEIYEATAVSEQNETLAIDSDMASSDDLSSDLVASNENATVSPYMSSGSWLSIDRVLSLGYSVEHPNWRVSSHLRSFRKLAANVTGLHGVLSGKPQNLELLDAEYEQRGMIRRRLAAIDRARRSIERASTAATNLTANRRLMFWKLWDAQEPDREFPFFPRRASSKSNEAERIRQSRVKEIDKQMVEAQKQLQQLACEKDVLQRSLNPLWNYTTEPSLEVAANESEVDAHDVSGATSRVFSFPPSDLVVEYLDMLFSSGRLTRMNHTDLWRNGDAEEYDHYDEWLSPVQREDDRKRRNANGDSGSWLLRNVLGSRLGETTETAAYKAVCSALMSVLAKSISNLHGVNVMTYSDIRLSTEQAPALPTIAAGIIPGSSQNRNYAHEAFADVMRRGSRKRRDDRRDSFVQREAVVETLTSQCQIAAPLLKLFPLAWQRALLSNIVIMATAVISDFCEGIEFQILGHRLTFAFTPITEDDMIRGMVRDSFNNPRRTHPELFEAAVRATAESVGESLNFLDKWHERALGSDLLRTQIATLIARLVLTLTDDALCGSRLDLWAAHAGGPRLLAALEYRGTDRS